MEYSMMIGQVVVSVGGWMDGWMDMVV